MDSLIYSLDATMPVFLVMLTGYFLKQIGMLNQEFVRVANKLNFNITLPVMLFLDLSTTDLSESFDPKYVGFTAAVTIIMIVGTWIGAKLFLKDKSIIGEFVQAGYRSSVAVLGVAFVSNMYGNAGLIPMIIIGSVPIYNIMAVVVLTFESSGETANSKEHLRKSIINILKNPIIIGIAAGILGAVVKIDFPQIIDKALASVAGLTSPLALICIGASFEGKKALAKIKPTFTASFIKLVVLPAVFLPIAVKLGFRDAALVGLIIMLGSPTTPSSYIMAKNMGSEGILTSSAIMTTTLFSTLTLTFWIFCAKFMGLIS